jgi:hypothetical protein
MVPKKKTGPNEPTRIAAILSQNLWKAWDLIDLRCVVSVDIVAPFAIALRGRYFLLCPHALCLLVIA